MKLGHKLEIRVLGGFEALLDGSPLPRFESRKARALFVYLALGRDVAMDRDLLATLFWAERGDESARRNLRQALYSIRSAISESLGGDDPFVESDKQTIKLDPELDVWIDVEAFRSSYQEGISGESPDVRFLSAAASLYRGDFLSGFYLRDCPEFEDWLIERQEEFREEAVETFRSLVSLYLARGEYRYGIRYARRLLNLDPLSEDAHRNLMRLYLIAGRRARSLAQYEHLLNLLQNELGVEPMEETTELYRSILSEQGVEGGEPSAPEPTAPMIPLVGRSQDFDRLQEAWEKASSGDGRLSLVMGEAGIGKSRLVKSFVDAVTSRRHAIVLRGRCYGASAPVCFRPFAEVVSGAFTDVLGNDEKLDDLAVSSGEMAILRRVAMKADDTVKAESGNGETDTLLPETVLEALLALCDALCAPRGTPPRPMILMLEDFHWADGPSLRLLDLLNRQISRRPIWLLLTARSDLSAHFDSPIAEPPLELDRLTAAHTDEIASALVGLSSSGELSRFLSSHGEGLPLMIAELINLLWDDGKLRSVSPGKWELMLDDEAAAEAPTSVSELVQRRLAVLPFSARRLLVVAAVYGHKFDVDILQEAADEHPTVIDTCVELALERWLIRQCPLSWSPAGLESDVAMWTQGARRGYFEFSSDKVRSSILERLNPSRRAVVHGEVAQAIETKLGDQAMLASEALVFHWLEADEPGRALPWIEACARDAFRCGDAELRDDYVAKGLEILASLEKKSTGDRPALAEIRSRLTALGARDLPVA